MKPVYIDDHGAVRILRHDVECTGVAARWCPIHGDCTDDPNTPDDGNRWSAHCSDSRCPLHGTDSRHAEAPR